MSQLLRHLWTPFQSLRSQARRCLVCLHRSRLTPWLFGSAGLAVVLLGLFYSSLIQAQSPVEVETFDADQAQLQLVAPDDVGATASSAVPSADLGGERDIQIELAAGLIDGTRLKAEVNNGVFSLGYDPAIAGSARLTWDGPDADGAVLDPTGLNGADLTAGESQDAFLLQVSLVDVPTSATLEVFTDAGNASSLVIPLAGGTHAPVDYVIPFSAFSPNLGAGAVFTDVGALSLFIDSDMALDMVIDAFNTGALLTPSKTDLLVVDNNGDGQASPGDTVQYIVTIANPDDAFDAAAAGVVFSDTLDLNTTLVVSSVTTSQGAITSGNGSGDTAVQVDAGSIADGDSVTITFDATVNDPLPAGVTEVANQGFVSSDGLTDLPTDDPDTGPAGDATLTPVFAGPLITATKADTLLIDNDGNSAADPGDTLQYTVILTNSGTAPATGVAFSDTLDLNTTLVVSSVTTTSGTVTSGNGGGDTGVSVAVGSLADGAGVTLTFEATINDPLPAGLSAVANQGILSADGLADTVTDDPDTAQSGDATVTALP